MPTREEKIDAIYAKIANKELSFGCRFKLKSGAITIATGSQSWMWITCLYFQQIRIDNIGEIIWHPVMLGDIIDFLNEKIRPYWLDCGDGEFYYAEWENTAWIIEIWDNKRKPIEDQSDDCVSFIYKLISEKMWTDEVRN